MTTGPLRNDLVLAATNGDFQTAIGLLWDVINESVGMEGGRVDTPRLRAGDGTEAAPSIVFEDDPDTGFYRVGTNSFALVVGGQTALTIKSNGAVEIPKRHLEFSDPSAILADASLSYSDVSAGDVLETRRGGFSYEVAAIGAGDADETTAGGVKLYETGRHFTGEARFLKAVARGETWPAGTRVWIGDYPYETDVSDVSAELLGADITSSAVDSLTDTITSTDHGLAVADAAVVTSAVNGLATNTIYRVIRVDADNFKLASNFADALTGTAIDLTGTSTVTVKPHLDPERVTNVPRGANISGASGVFARPRRFGIPTWELGLRPESGMGEANLKAWQAALDYARDHDGDTILLPSGTVEVAGMPIVRSSGTRIIGMGAAGSFFNDDGGQNKGTHVLYTGSGDPAVIGVGDDVHKFTGIEMEQFTIDANYQTVDYRVERGIINNVFSKIHAFWTTTGCEVYGDDVLSSFGNHWIDDSFEHFTQFGLDFWGDGNESLVFGSKFMNTSNNNPTSSIRAGAGKYLAGLWLFFNSFGSTNMDHHIHVVQGDNIHIEYNTIEASGNSNVGNRGREPCPVGR